MVNSIFIFIIEVIGGILGRLGGDGAGRLYRLMGVPGSCVAIMLIMYHPLNWWYYGALLATFWLVLATTSTYYKKKDSPVLWWNWCIYGAMEGIAFLPVACFNGRWVGYALRTVITSVLLTVWDDLIGIDWLEEFGRYFIVALTTPIIMLI